MTRLLAVNVGLPQDIAWQGRTVHTAVWKRAVMGRRMARRLNLDGDGQGDLTGHGGEHRAVFVYQIESYRYWERELGRDDFSFGQFGENPNPKRRSSCAAIRSRARRTQGSTVSASSSRLPVRPALISGGFRKAFDAGPALQHGLHRYVHELMAQITQTAACNRFHTVDARLARWLLMTRDRMCSADFYLTHEFLGHMLGVRRVGVETVACSCYMRVRGRSVF